MADTDDLVQRRRFYAEELEAVCHLRSPALVEAFATVPREHFVPPGPWLTRGEAGLGAALRRTPDADPRHLYHNVAVAIDATRDLFNGAPSVVARGIDALDLRAGDRVLHVGCGVGYYSAIMARCVGPRGAVVAVEIDEALAGEARTRLRAFDNVEVTRGDGRERYAEGFDAILVNVGVTHPLEAWLAALKPRGRLVLPLTCATGPNLGKGLVVRLAETGARDALDARVVTMVAIYSAAAIRDPAMNDHLGRALARNPWPPLRRLRLDAHDAAPACWLHADRFCLSTA